MSADSLSNMVNFKHKIPDDLESIFYVALYCSLRWLPLELIGDEELGDWMLTFFDGYRNTPGGDVGGYEKSRYRGNPALFSQNFKFDNSAIQTFFTDGYSKLWTNQIAFNSLRKSIPLTWTSESLQELFKTIKSAPPEKLSNNDKIFKELGPVYQRHVQAPFAFRPTSSRFESGKDNDKREVEMSDEEQGNKRMKVDTGAKGS